MNKLYGPDGSFNTGKKLPQKYQVPKGTPLYYGAQESLLNKPDTNTRVGGFMSFNMPSPYKNPNSNYGSGPYVTNVIQEVMSAPDPSAWSRLPVLREPTKDNPMMNVMPLDYDQPQVFGDYYHYEKSTYPSSKDLEIRGLVKNDFEDGLIQNSDSLFWNRLNSQREWVSQPVGGVPSNQAEFANWLYGTPGDCKMGSVFVNYGVQYTDDSLLCNGFNVAEPTNKGLLNGNLMSSVQGGGYSGYLT